MTLPFTNIHSPPSSQPHMAPVRVNLLRPKCFCGLTSVSIYPEPPIDVSAPKTVHKTNWAYECHYTPKQKNMARPDPCDDCEDERRRRSIRPTELKTTGNAITFGLPTKPPFRIRHQAEQIDQVELWPRRKFGLDKAGTIETMAEQMVSGTGKNSAAPVGADLGRVATFNGLSSSDRQKVCGFHMHALEWHHMQTTGVDAILSLAKQTGCEEFNLSVVRWLGDKVRTNVTNNSDTVPSTSATALTNTYSNRTNVNTSSMGLKIKLYADINCGCGGDTVIAKGPTIQSPFRPPSKERQFLIVCRKRAQANPSSLEIVESSLRDIPSGHHGYDHRVNRSRPKPTTDKVGKCISSISIDTAVFWCHSKPIHPQIENNRWLSQWLSPPKPSQPTASSRSRSIIRRAPTIGETATKRSAPTTTQYNSLYPMIPTTLRSRSTSTKASTSLTPNPLATQFFERYGQPQSTLSLPSPTSPLSPTKRGPIQEPARQPAIGVTNGTAELGELDRELEETVAWHVAAVTSIMDAQDNPSLSAPMSTPNYVDAVAERQYTNYKEINMEEMYPSIAMHLCQQCKDSARDFCVVPLSVKNPYPGDYTTAFTGISTMHTTTENHWSATATSDWSPPPSPQQSPDIHLLDTPNTYTSSYWTPPDAIVGNRGSERLDRELERVDRDLEWVMKRHAGTVLETMDVRSRLVPGLLLCRGCEYRATVRDVLPCCHALLCIDCVHQLEFYLVPRANTWVAMA